MGKNGRRSKSKEKVRQKGKEINETGKTKRRGREK